MRRELGHFYKSYQVEESWARLASSVQNYLVPTIIIIIILTTLLAVEFFQQINMLYGTLAEFCTESTCPTMSAGPRYEYYWADGQTVKKPVKCSAPRYINNLMIWAQNHLENEAIFPSRIGMSPPSPSYLCRIHYILHDGLGF